MSKKKYYYIWDIRFYKMDENGNEETHEGVHKDININVSFVSFFSLKGHQ